MQQQITFDATFRDSSGAKELLKRLQLQVKQLLAWSSSTVQLPTDTIKLQLIFVLERLQQLELR